MARVCSNLSPPPASHDHFNHCLSYERAWLIRRNMSFPIMDYDSEFDRRCLSKCTSVRTNIRRKIGPLTSHVSRSVKVIESDTVLSGIHELLLVIPGNRRLISFPRYTAISVCKFFHPSCVYSTPLRRLTVGILLRCLD